MGTHQRYLEEKREWFEQAVETYQQPLTAYAARMHRKLERAQEAVQETFLKLWEVPPGEVDNQLPAWLFAVCRQRVIDGIRREHLMEAQGEVTVRSLRPKGLSDTEIPVQQDPVLEALEGLPERQQEVLRLCFQHGLVLREISRVTGLSESNAGEQLHAGLSALNERLARRCVDAD